MTGADLVLSFLEQTGIRHLFGNPGTTELPLMAALPRFPLLIYHPVLQESVAVSMADGYAQSARQLAAVLLHATGGVANGLGLLYNAARAGTPLLVVAGQQSRSLALQEGFLHSDMETWLRPLVKWAVEVRTPDDLLRALRRAVHTAVAAPSGPVAVIIPVDLLAAAVPPPLARDLVAVPCRMPEEASDNTLAALAHVLSEARRPAVLAGDHIARETGGPAALTRLLDRTGWPLWLESYPTRAIYPANGPALAGILPRTPGAVAQALAPYDLVVAVGARLFEPFLDDGGTPLPAGTRLVALDQASEEIGRHVPITIGYAGPLAPLLDRLRPLLQAGSRTDTLGLRPHPLWAALGAGLSPDTIIVEEAISWRLPILASLPRPLPDTLYGQKGGTIGWALGAALGISLARPGQPILAIIGDGSFLMAVQGLWNAARLKTPVTYLVLDNAGYGILRQVAATFYPDAPATGLEISGVTWPALCDAFGIPFADVAGDRLAAAVSEALAQRTPHVLRLKVSDP
ncbi:MAG: thiamine pyrophosphate-binding protein [Thermaerobacter sp.]|nr:thiamine pyrophosphate-binding protein [Thermaerobacter sp.]